MYSYGSPHTAAQKQDDQHERTFSSCVSLHKQERKRGDIIQREAVRKRERERERETLYKQARKKERKIISQ